MTDSPLAPGDMRAETPSGWRLFETALLTVAVPGIRFAVGSTDPFGLRWEFPWLVFVPLAIGVQHGVGCAAASLAALGGAATLYADWIGAALPSAKVAFACGAIALGASRACDLLRERCERLRERVAQLERACERERRAREVLRLAHDELLQHFASAPECVERVLASAVGRVPGMRSVHQFARCVLDVLVHHAELHEGSVWLDVQGDLVCVAATRGGDDGHAKPGPRARQAMRTGNIVPPSGTAALDAVVPLVAADGKVRGVLMVDQMPLDALVPDALHRMSILVSGLAAPVDPSTWDEWATRSSKTEPASNRNPAQVRSGAWDAIG